jgi:hypothetical protein
LAVFSCFRMDGSFQCQRSSVYQIVSFQAKSFIQCKKEKFYQNNCLIYFQHFDKNLWFFDIGYFTEKSTIHGVLQIKPKIK